MWPPIAEAEIRPGVRVLTAGSQCTSNFVFRDLVSDDLLLGLAAHCTGHTGQSSTIRGIDGDPAATGTVAYRSWDHTSDKDFALIRIPDADAGKVHPAMLHFGGPTGLANTGELAGGEKFLFYGNSGLRSGIEQSNRHEGYVTITGTHTTHGHVVTPAIPGDSGSGVLDGQGRALGVIVTVGVSVGFDSGVTPFYWTGTNAFTNLDAAIASAEASTGMDIELQTWALHNAGVLPDLNG